MPLPHRRSRSHAIRSLRSFTLPRPSDRAMALVTAPPIAPPDNICISISAGKTIAIAASEMVPSWPMYQASTMLTLAHDEAAAFGVAIRSSVGRIAPSTICWERAVIEWPRTGSNVGAGVSH